MKRQRVFHYRLSKQDREEIAFEQAIFDNLKAHKETYETSFDSDKSFQKLFHD